MRPDQICGENMIMKSFYTRSPLGVGHPIAKVELAFQDY